MRYCDKCGAEVSGARYCSQCGAHVQGTSPLGPEGIPFGSGSVGLSDNQLGALAYVTPIPAIAFLLFEPYRNIPFVRFHSYQSLFLTFAAIILMFATGILSIFHFLQALLGTLVQLALFALWALAAYRAWLGEEYALPVIGEFASRHARG